MSRVITVRHATTHDAPLIARLITTAFAEYRDRLVPPSGALNETAAGIAAELATPERLGFVAFDAAGAVGCVLCKPDSGDLYFGRLSVAPACRGRGIARRLIDTVEVYARDQGFPATLLAVRISLPENRALFERCGYVEISRHAHEGFDQPTNIRMRKALAQQGK